MSKYVLNVNAHYHNFTSYFQELNQFKLGFVTSLLTLSLVHFMFICLTIDDFFVLTILAIVRTCMTLFQIFSLYTCLTLIFSKHWSDTKIFQLFLITFFGEFITQRLTQNTSLDVTSANVSSTILMAGLLSISYLMTNLKTKIDKFLVFMGVTCMTRCYGSYQLLEIVPQPVAPYISYMAAFGGCIFSHYVVRCLREYSDDNQAQEYFNLKNNASTSNSLSSSKLLFMFNDINSINAYKMKPGNFNINSRRVLNSNNNSHNRINNNSSLSSVYKRRTSLPTIPLKLDKPHSDSNLLDEIHTQINKTLRNAGEDLTSDRIFNSLKLIKRLINQVRLNSSLIDLYFTQPYQQHSSNLKKSSTTTIKLANNNSNDEDDNLSMTSQFLLKRHSLINSAYTSLLTATKYENSNEITSNIPSLRSSIDLDDLVKPSTSQIKLNSSLNKFIKHDDEYEENTILNSKLLNLSKTSDYDSGESPNSSDYSSDTDKLQLKEQFVNNQSSITKMDQIKEDILNRHNKAKKRYTNTWSPEKIRSIHLLEDIHAWNFPIFQLYEKSNNNILSHMAYKIFEQVGLFESFNIPIDLFINYFTALESGYNDLPYHNKLHAADVLHACYYLTTATVPNFQSWDQSLYNPKIKDRKNLNLIYRPQSLLANLSCETFCCVGNNFTPLEILALYCSAAMHDFEHPGRNNQFLISTKDPLALLYNDVSVLENHHASASWRLLKSDAEYNFLINLDAAEWKHFRNLVIENILATDLSKHFGLIGNFKNRVNTNVASLPGKSSIDWKNEQDRLIVGQMIIKLSDINAPLKEKDLHVQWTERICEEFYQQGEEEFKLGLTKSPHMDRSNPKMAQLQECFIANLVNTLCDPFKSAGLLPGILIEDPDMSDCSDKPIPKKFCSELASNLKNNYEMWVEIVKSENTS